MKNNNIAWVDFTPDKVEDWSERIIRFKDGGKLFCYSTVTGIGESYFQLDDNPFETVLFSELEVLEESEELAFSIEDMKTMWEQGARSAIGLWEEGNGFGGRYPFSDYCNNAFKTYMKNRYKIEI